MFSIQHTASFIILTAWFLLEPKARVTGEEGYGRKRDRGSKPSTLHRFGH